MQTIVKMTFLETLYKRSDDYLDSNRFGKYANALFAVKGILLMAIYIGTYIYFILYSNHLFEMLLSCTVLGICHVFIPANLSHDAIHRAVSRHGWINNIYLYGFELTGSNSYMYNKKHLEAHYNKENSGKLKAYETQALILQKKSAGKSVNLPWIFYLFYSEYMLFVRDFVLFFTDSDKPPLIEKMKLIFFKTLYLTAFLIIPFIFNDSPWWQIVISLVFMYLIVTLVLVIILLMPTEKMEHSKTGHDNKINENWAMEILAHNVDFSPDSHLLNLLVGGANMNVVHYLYPSVNHVHYTQLAKIIEETAQEFGLHYRKQSVIDVVGIHLKYIRNIQHTTV